MQGKLTKKECSILHDAMHLANLHNLEGEDVNVAICFGNKQSYVKYSSKDVWKIMHKLVKGMK
jgi:hypothetical protein|tara:strand:+ start:293 stop:481 length:189 start_codon:yes stop_codon:yes gene_type:complete